MSDLIDRQAAIDAIRKIYDSVGILGEKWAVDKCQMAIKDLPSAEPEIVRCKDCKYYNPIGVCIEMSSAVCEDSFCCWAERKENG